MKRFTYIILTVLVICIAMSSMAISLFAKEKKTDSQPDDDQIGVPIEFTASFEDERTDAKGGSVLSDGSLAIIIGVAAAVVFGLGGFFIGKAEGKKRKPADFKDSEKEDEE